MNLKLREELDMLHAQMCSTLSDPKRILILYLLDEGPKTVTQLITETNLAQPAISRKMKVLRERNMLTIQREGHNLLYSISDHRLIEALDLLRGVLFSSIELQAALARAANSEINLPN